MDHTPPITTSNIPSGWNRVSSFICNLFAIDYADTIYDTPSGVDKTYYTTDGSEPTILSSFGPNIPGEDITEFTINSQGTTIVKYFSVDNNGNTEITKTSLLKIDNIAPVTICSAVLPDGDNGWYKTNPLISLLASDTNSGILATYYRWDSQTIGQYAGPFQIPSEGIHTLQFYSVDIAGNVENTNTTFFKFDHEPPVTQDDAPIGQQIHPVTISFFTSDNASGPANTFYSTDGSTPTTPGSSVTLTQTGIYTIKYFSVDFAGNAESIKQSSANVFIDVGVPQTFISENIPINGTNGWYRTSPLISLTAVDSSGIANTFYKLFPSGKSTTAKYTSTVDISATVDLSVNSYILLEVDKGSPITINLAGFIPEQTTISEIVNTINSVVGLTIATETARDGSAGYGYVTVSSPTAGTGSANSEIGFLQPALNDATNEVFGLDESTYPYYFTESVVYLEYTGPISISLDGHWQLDCYSVDNEGNIGTTSSKQYKLDSRVPLTRVTTSYPPDGQNNWYITNPQITLQAIDILSGIYKTIFQWDNGIKSEYNGQILEIPDPGTHILKYYSIDLASNIESIKTSTFRFETTCPLTTDDTYSYQGIIFTNLGTSGESIIGEQAQRIDSTHVKMQNTEVISVTKVYDLTSEQEYHQRGNITGVDQNEITIYPFKSENSQILGSYEIQLDLPVGAVLLSFSDVLKIYNATQSVYYVINESLSSLNGHLFLQGASPLVNGDILQVDYMFDGIPIPPDHVIVVDYTFISPSHESKVLNSLDYALVEPIYPPPFIHDHNITIHLYPSDLYSSVEATYYTIDGSDPTLNSQQGTVINLTNDGTYTIKYFSVNIAGVQEPIRTARYLICIDKKIPTLELTAPAPDGENNWHKSEFTISANISTSDVMERLNDEIVKQNLYRIVLDQNDTIDFEETSIELTATILPGLYTRDQLRIQIQSALNAIGTSTYTVTLLDDQYSDGELFRITSNLAGGHFSILWLSGTHSSQSIGKYIGFDVSSDLIGFSNYTSDYFKICFNNYFVKEITSVRTSITNEDLQVIEIVKGASGFYDEAFVSGQLPISQDITENLTVSYLSGIYYSAISQYPILVSTLEIRDPNGDLVTDEYQYDNNTGRIVFSNSFIQIPGFYVAKYVIKDKILADYTHFIGIEKVQFGVDNLELTTITIQVYNDINKFVGLDLINNKANFSFQASQFFLIDGQHTVFAKAYDHNSILGTGVPQKISTLEEIVFSLDRIAPVTTDDVSNLPWRRAPVVVTLTPFDDFSGSRIAETHYTLDGSVPTRLSPSGTTITILNSGIYNLQYFSIDKAGNFETVKSAAYAIKIDNTAPKTTLLTVPTTPDGDNGWFVSAPLITFNVIESQSGVAETYYKIGESGFFFTYSAPFTLSTQGHNKITFYSVDNVGNVETQNIVYIDFDSVAPETTTDAPVGYTCNKTVSFIVTDVASGVDTTYFTIDGSDPDLLSPHGNSVTFNASGTYVLKFFSVDIAGNIETSIKTQTVKFDFEPPVLFNFLPLNGIITDTTTQISFEISDDLSGVDINAISLDIDGIQYSTTKNSSYFNFTGTPLHYTVTVYPIQGVLSFEDIEILRVRNVKDLAGNVIPVLEYNFTQADTQAPWVKETYPAPSAKDVSTDSNVIVFIDDDISGVNLKTIEIDINTVPFKVNTTEILKFQYIGSAETATLQIFNKTFSTFINGQRDVYVSLYDSNYSSIIELTNYINSLPNYKAEILNEEFEQKDSSLLLSTPSVNILQECILDLFATEQNLNFSFFERSNGYVVFVSPEFSFEHMTPVQVVIKASDNSGNEMVPFSYAFIPHIYATSSVKKRNYLNTTALTYIGDIQQNIASNYTRSKSSTFYSHHKAISLEIARHEEELEKINLDRSYNTLNPVHLYDKLGYMLLTNPSSDLSQDDYRLLLQSLISILFKGSLKSSLEAGASLFTNAPVNIVELVFSKGSDISEQFMITVDIIIDGSNTSTTSIDIIALNQNLTNIFNLVKPAHVYIIQRFVWSEQFNFQAGCTLQWEKDQYGNFIYDQFGEKIPIIAADGLQAAQTNSDTAICDRYKYDLKNFELEDVQEDCREKLEKIIIITENVSGQFTGIEDHFHTTNWPILKDENNVAEFNDVIVTVNGLNATIIEMDPLSGFIRINIIPRRGSEVLVTYNYNDYFVFTQISFILNDYNVLGNDFDPNSGSIFNYDNINTVAGGIQIGQLPRHAHVCETFVNWKLLEEIGDTYTVLECNNRKFFYLNNYTVEGNDFNQNEGSYFNDINSVNRSTTCPMLFFEISDKQEEQIELPIIFEPSFVIDGREGGLTSDIKNHCSDESNQTIDKRYSYNLLTLQSAIDHFFHFGIDFKDETNAIDEDFLSLSMTMSSEEIEEPQEDLMSFSMQGSLFTDDVRQHSWFFLFGNQVCLPGILNNPNFVLPYGYQDELVSFEMILTLSEDSFHAIQESVTVTMIPTGFIIAP